MRGDQKLDRIILKKKTGIEPFHAEGVALPVSVRDFWAWSSSDLLGNALRGLVAEFLVATAIGATDDVRQEWDAYDLLLPNGTRIEVKSAAYLQSWAQEHFSTIGFDIAPKRGWDARENVVADTASRMADIYVFCLLHHRDKQTVDPLNIGQWTFYVLPTNVLNEHLGAQKKISLKPLLKLEPEVVSFDDLAATIERAAGFQH